MLAKIAHEKREKNPIFTPELRAKLALKTILGNASKIPSPAPQNRAKRDKMRF